MFCIIWCLEMKINWSELNWTNILHHHSDMISVTNLGFGPGFGSTSPDVMSIIWDTFTGYSWIGEAFGPLPMKQWDDSAQELWAYPSWECSILFPLPVEILKKILYFISKYKYFVTFHMYVMTLSNRSNWTTQNLLINSFMRPSTASSFFFYFFIFSSSSSSFFFFLCLTFPRGLEICTSTTTCFSDRLLRVLEK